MYSSYLNLPDAGVAYLCRVFYRVGLVESLVRHAAIFVGTAPLWRVKFGSWELIGIFVTYYETLDNGFFSAIFASFVLTE